MLENVSKVGHGGAGGQGYGPGSVQAILTELQGLAIALLTGAGANTKIALAAIRPEDTILSAINNNAGTLTDITNTMSIVDPRATGTLTLSGVAADQTVTVAGKTYTAVDGVAANSSEFTVDGDDTADAAALAAAINATENGRDLSQVTATSAAGVVTVKAIADGTAGNSIALTKSAAGVTLSGATLSGGTATGGVQSTGVTNQILLHWYNKR